MESSYEEGASCTELYAECDANLLYSETLVRKRRRELLCSSYLSLNKITYLGTAWAALKITYNPNEGTLELS